MAAADIFMLPLVVLSSIVVLIILIHHFLPLFILKKKTLPKGCFGWPFIGETVEFLNPHPSNTIGPFLQDHCSRYGKVFRSHLFWSPTIVSCDEELNYFILQNEGKLFECSYPKSIHGILGKVSMLVAVNDTHKRLRNVALSLVTTTKSKPQFLNDVQHILLNLFDSWLLKKQVIFSEEARKFTFNVIVKQVLGLTPEEAISMKILQDFKTFMRGLISFPLYIPGTPYAKAVQARSRIFSSVRAIIEDRIRRNAENNCSSCSKKKEKKKNDFLDILIDNDTLSLDEKVSFVLDSLLGGYETTSLLISMLVYFIGQSPPAFDQLKVEHDNIRKMKKKDEFLNWEDYQKMNFTQQVINEALRSGNIVKFVHRKALKDVKFKDYVIPSGWKVLPIFSAVHLDPAIHANPFHFNPWRWEDDQTCKKLTPFGGGSRCCPGSELAKVEVAFFLHYLVRNFRWTVADDEQPIAYPYVEFRRGLTINISRSSE